MLVQTQQAGQKLNESDLKISIRNGAGQRIRPVMMTAMVIILGLMPILFGDGTGSEVMSRIAAPMVGGMESSVVLILLVLLAIYFLWHKPRHSDSDRY